MKALTCIVCCLWKEEDESEGWLEGWRHLDQLVPGVGALLAFTSYTKLEARQDLARFSKYAPPDCRLLQSAEVNPMGSRRPIRDWATDGDEDVFFANQYLSVVARDRPTELWSYSVSLNFPQGHKNVTLTDVAYFPLRCERRVFARLATLLAVMITVPASIVHSLALSWLSTHRFFHRKYVHCRLPRQFRSGARYSRPSHFLNINPSL